MAATLAQPAFGLQPSNDDTMEISSDFGAMDGDIDIDLDSAGEQTRYEDDDQMIDDVKSDRGSYHDDDVMLDGDTASNQGDREMQDDAPLPPQENDEELLDFSEDEDLYADDAPLDPPDVHITEPPIEQPAPTPTSAPAPTTEEPVEQVQSEAAAELLLEGVDVVDSTSQDNQAELEPQSVTLSEEQEQSASEEDNVFDQSETQDKASAIQPFEQGESQDTVQSLAEGEVTQPEPIQSNESAGADADATTQQHVEPATEAHVYDQPTEVADDNNVTSTVADTEADQTAAQPVSLTVDTEVAGSGGTDNPASPSAQRPSSPTVTGMHPTIVEYRGEEIYLFPPRKPTGNETFLLQNENLANTSLGDLLQACRSVLDHTLSDDDELVLGVQELDLYISEDSTPAFSTKFSELLDAYVQLHKNDGNHNPDPFIVTLKTQTRFTNRLNLITQALAAGKGFSELSFLEQPGFPDEEDFDDEYFSDDHHTREQHEGHATEQQNTDYEQLENQQDEISAEEPAEKVAEQAQEDHYGGNDNNTDSHVSYEAAQQRSEHVEPASGVQEHTREENVPDETQYYESYEDADGQDQDQDQHDDPSAADTTQDAATEEYGEDDTINFDEDNDSSLTTTTASAEGNLVDPLPDDSLATDHVSLAEDNAPAAGELDEIPPPPEDEHFDEDFGDESHQEEAAVEADQQVSADAVEDYNFEVDEASASVFDASKDAGTDETSKASSITLEAEQEAQSNNDEQAQADKSAPLDDDEQHQTELDTIDLGEDLSAHETAGQDESLSNDQHEDEAGANTVPNDGGAKAEYDPDFIDFDDDEEFDNEPTPSKENAESESTQGSPSIKRSYSERNEAEEIGADGQALKKVRSS